MAQAGLLQGGHVVMSSKDDALTLTNYRVKYEMRSGGASVYRSTPLSKVSACSVNTKTYPVLIWAATLLGILGLLEMFSPERVAMSGMLIIAAVLGALYCLVRPSMLAVISDAGASIELPTKGLRHEDTRRFVEAVAFEISKSE